MSDYNDKAISEFRSTGGEVTGFGHGLVLLHAFGAKTGQERIHPVAGLSQPDGTWLVMASKGGAPTHPSWYHNLIAHPDTTVEVGVDGQVATVPITVSEVGSDDYEAAFAQFVARSQAFAQYRERSEGRVMPILRLSPR